jgi:acid phosphatase
MPGAETGGVGNFWYSFDYGLAHFVAIDGETDFAGSPEWPFARDVKGNETHPTPDETFVTDSGPFGAIEGGRVNDNKAYQQYKWLEADLASVDRKKTPWVIAMSHRPMYSSQVSSYQAKVRAAFEGLMLRYGVDAYLSGHIHWYERLWPMGANGTVDRSAVVDEHTYLANTGTSMTHIVNGMAGNIESHSTLDESKILNITAVLNQKHFGFSKVTVHNATTLTWTFIRGDGVVGDQLTLIKKKPAGCKKTKSHN